MNSNYYWIFYAASCFFFYFIGRQTGYYGGYEIGKKHMKALIEQDLRIYPNKWRSYINKVNHVDN